MAGYHSALAILPGTSYEIIVLLVGRYHDAAKIAYDAFEIFQSAIDGALAEAVSMLYGGRWASQDGNSSALITGEKGVLWMTACVLEGVNVPQMFGTSRLALRWLGR